MFHTILTLSYTIPALYLFIRILQLFIDRRDRLKYVIVFAFLFSIFPFSNVLDGEAPGAAREMIISASVLIVIAGIINFNTIRTSEYKIAVPVKSSDIKSLRIAFVSDFHLEYKVPARFVESFVDKIRETDPDLILYGGDIVEGSGENRSYT